ncbi:unnamed protein product [Discula destructiva]
MPPAGSSLYGKWHNFALDEDRMLHELDVNVSDSTVAKEVDRPGNEDDIQLWACLLEFAHRRMGRDGVIMIWESVSKRRNLFQVDGPLAPRFWRQILDTAVSDENLLRDVVSYAEWLYRTHAVRWPKIYSTVMTHMLESSSEKDDRNQARLRRETVLKWHFALAPSFGPSEEEFITLLKTFSRSSSQTMLETLRSLYVCSPYRRMYDILIPYLYSAGHVHHAMKWRVTLLSHKDFPTSLTSRPFLRFLGAYYPNTRLAEGELGVAGLVSNTDDAEQLKSEAPEVAMSGQNLSYLINRVHGETFAITEKTHNDNLCAKWFASSWVSLDFAINVIYTMGVQAIGPLSLQSIALREDGASGVLRRIEQLRQLKIELPASNYAKAVGHYASVGDNDALQELLGSDMHPDIFDDEEAQHNLLNDCLRVSDWNTYQLVLRTRLAVMSSSRATATDRALETCVRQGNGSKALKIMREMSSQKFELASTTSHIISGFILRNVSPHSKNVQPALNESKHLDLHVSLSCQLAGTRFPPAVQVWQNLLYRLGREKRLEDLERLCFRILRLYTDYAKSEQPMWVAHMADVPPILRFESPFPNFQKLPRDLPIQHEKHPLRQIFDAKMQSAIVRWGFLYTPYNRRAEGSAASLLNDPSAAAAQHAPPATFHLARGIRLLAMLRDGGLYVNMPSVRKQSTLRLVDLFRGEGRASYEWVDGSPRLTDLRRQLRFSLAETKRLCDEAWGKDEVVSSLLDLEQKTELAEQMDQVKEMRRRVEALKNPDLAKRKGGRGRV